MAQNTDHGQDEQEATVMMTPTQMVECAVECAENGDEAGAELWLVEARRYVSFARIHELVNKMIRQLRSLKALYKRLERVFEKIDPALLQPLELAHHTA